jgi:hypothetical protein
VTQANDTPKFFRSIPLAVMVVSYAVCGALQWLGNDWVRWAHIVLMAVAISLVSRPSMNLGQRVLRGLSISALVSLLLVGLGLAIGWVEDRPHFFDDGGPFAALLVTEFYVGLPMIALATAFGAMAPLGSRLLTQRSPT